MLGDVTRLTVPYEPHSSHPVAPRVYSDATKSSADSVYYRIEILPHNQNSW